MKRHQFPDSDRICVGTHRHEPERQRGASYGNLCVGCHDRLEQSLAEMAALHDDLLARMAALWHGSGEGLDDTKVGPPTTYAIGGRPLPMNPAVSDHREQMRRVVASWCSLVAEETSALGPATPRLTDTSAWLLGRLRWSTEQAWVDEYLEEIGGLASKARSLIAANPRRRFVCGPCPGVVDEPCLGTLSASIGPRDDLLPGYVECDTDPAHHWTSGQFVALGRRIHGAAGIHEAGARMLAQRLGMEDRPA